MEVKRNDSGEWKTKKYVLGIGRKEMEGDEWEKRWWEMDGKKGRWGNGEKMTITGWT